MNPNRDLKKMSPGERRFHLWWNLYNRKEGYGAARRKFVALSEEIQKHILEITPAYVEWKNERQYRPMPTTFLNQERYYDEIPGLSDEGPQDFTDEDLAELMRIEQGIEGGER